MILTPPTSLTVVGQKWDTALVNTMIKYATEIQGYIDPRALIKTSKFITVMVFQEYFIEEDLIHGTSTLYDQLFSFLMCLPPFYPLL